MENSVLSKFEKAFTKVFVDAPLSETLIKYCVESISKNDTAHNLDHVLIVCSNAKWICDQEQVSFEARRMVYAGALLHDIGCKYNRKNHHIIGCGLVYEILNQVVPGEFGEAAIDQIATAVLEHRSSSSNKPSSVISEIVSVADSGKPDIDTYIKRAVQFRLHQDDMDKERIIREVCLHLEEKFGVSGYHWKSYPEMGKIFYEKEIEEMRMLLMPGRWEGVVEKISVTYDRLMK